jgi:hypothetical protein
MTGLESSSTALLADDVPAPPPSYNEYVQRRLSESIRKAYVRGVNRGFRRQALVLCCGTILGCLSGFYLAMSSQRTSCYGADGAAYDSYFIASKPSLRP